MTLISSPFQPAWRVQRGVQAVCFGAGPFEVESCNFFGGVRFKLLHDITFTILATQEYIGNTLHGEVQPSAQATIVSCVDATKTKEINRMRRRRRERKHEKMLGFTTWHIAFPTAEPRPRHKSSHGRAQHLECTNLPITGPCVLAGHPRRTCGHPRRAWIAYPL